MGVVELEVVVISEEELMDVRALHRQGYGYAEIGRLLGRDWRTVKRYLEDESLRESWRRVLLSALFAPRLLKLDRWEPGAGAV